MTDAVIILGMHRSGTSCLTGCLRSYGLQLGSVSEYNKYNQKGNQENKVVFRLNEALLKFNSGSWSNPPQGYLSLNTELENSRDKIITEYKTLEKPWGIKDPRMLLTYSFWENSLPDHALIGTFRHPKAVAHSLAARERLSLPLEQGYELWKIYNQKLLELHQHHQFPVVNFDTATDQYQQKVKQAAEKIGLKVIENNDFFDPNLISQEQFEMADCPDELKSIYADLLVASVDS